MKNVPERFIWATQLINIQPDDTILEIGCGAGLLAELMSELIDTGKVLAIDKSAPMIEKAKKRNQRYIDRKVLKFIVNDFSKCELRPSYYDKVVAFNVNLFVKAQVKELKLIQHILKKDGTLYVFHQEPFEITIEAAASIKKSLLENNFKIVDITLKKLLPTSAICVIAKLD